MFIILNTFLVISSVIFWPFAANDSFLAIKEAVFVLGALSLFSYSFCCQSFFSLRNPFLATGLFYIALGFVYFFYSSFITANGKVIWNFWNFRPTVSVLCGILIIKLLYECASTKDWVDTGKVIAWLGGIFALYSIFQYFSIDQIFKNEKILYVNGHFDRKLQMVSFFGSVFLTSGFLALCAPMCLIFKDLRYKFFYVAILIALILLDKTMALASFGTGLVVYLLMNRSWVKLILLILIFITGGIFYAFYNPEFFSLTGRVELWKITWNKFLEAPFFGHGLGSFEMFQFKPGNTVTFFAHNEYLQILFDIGIVGFSIFVLFVVDLFKRIFVSENNILLIGYIAGLISFLVLCLGSFPLRIAPLALIAVIYTAGILSQTKGAIHE